MLKRIGATHNIRRIVSWNKFPTHYWIDTHTGTFGYLTSAGRLLADTPGPAEITDNPIFSWPFVARDRR